MGPTGVSDAAERIITTLLPSDEFDSTLRDELVRDAHRSIIAEERRLDPSDIAAVDAAIEDLRTRPIDRKLRGSGVAELLGRASNVTAQVLGQVHAALLVEMTLRGLRAVLYVVSVALRPTWRAIGAALTVVLGTGVLIAVGDVKSMPWMARLGWTVAAALTVLAILLAVVFLASIHRVA